MIQLFPQKVVIFSKGISVVHKSNKLKAEKLTSRLQVILSCSELEQLDQSPNQSGFCGKR